MNTRQRMSYIAICLACLFGTAQVRGADETAVAAPRQFITRHQGTFNGKLVHYTATAGDTLIENEQHVPIGYVFSFAYTRDELKDAAARPVVFVFNGGPGSSSFWLHMGALGPKRVSFPTPLEGAGTPFKLVDNTVSPLDIADLVFMDPVGTGFSRMLKEGKAADFYGTEADARVTAEFIRRWLSEHNRWNSPKLLVGESFGASRAALTAKFLMGGVGTNRFAAISLDGIALAGAYFGPDGAETDTDFAAALPGLAASAWYQQKATRAGRSFDAFMSDARQFAAHEYLPALYAGNALDEAEKQRIVGRLHEFLGVSPEFISRQGLRVDIRSFAAELLADQGLTLSIYDSRYSFAHSRLELDAVGDDPSMTRLGPTALAGLASYMRTDLGVKIDSRYEPISWVGSKQWQALSPAYNLALDLGRAMRQNPRLQLLLACGDYDLITSAGTVQYSISHGEVPADRVHFVRYSAGHMPYVGEENVRKFNADLHDFITAVSR